MPSRQCPPSCSWPRAAVELCRKLPKQALGDRGLMSRWVVLGECEWISPQSTVARHTYSAQEGRYMAARKSSGKAVPRSRTEFLNIDVDLTGAADLDELERALFPTLVMVHQEPGRVSLELSHQPKDAGGGFV